MLYRAYFLLLMTFIISASIEQDLTQLSVELSALQNNLKPKASVATKDILADHVMYTLSNGKRIKVLKGDVTTLNVFNKNTGTFSTLQVDAIVNAANEDCLGGSGIDGAIHSAITKTLGKKVFREICKNLPQKHDGNRCKTGEAELVPGLTLAKIIVQAVGPQKGTPNRAKLLKDVYENSLKKVDQSDQKLRSLFNLKDKNSSHSNKEIYENNNIKIPDDLTIKSIVFPAISTGIYQYPKEEAAEIATDTVYNYLHHNPESNLEEVSFIFFGGDDLEYNKYLELLDKKM